MRPINHFVIRNGKLVAKTQAQKMPDPSPQRLSIVKPASIIVKHLNMGETVADPDNNQEVIGIRVYYQGIIRRHEERIRELQKQLFQKNQLISKFGKETNKMHESQGLSTARQSRFSSSPAKDQNQSVSQFKQKSKQVNASKQQNGRNAQTQNQQDKKVNQLERENCSQHFSFDKKIELSSIPSNGSLPSSQIQKQSKCESTDGKKFFDTSTLMARLNKSASLVRNIKKFLQPTAMSPQAGSFEQSCIAGSQTQSKQLEPKKLQMIKVCSQQQREQLPDEQSQAQFEEEYQKFINQLIEKHEQILKLMQQLTVQKDQQVKQIKQHYQQIISKMQSSRMSNASAYMSSSSFKSNTKNSKVMLRNANMITQNKQNKKYETIISKINQKQKNLREYMHISTANRRRIPLEMCRSKYEENFLEIEENDQQKQKGSSTQSESEPESQSKQKQKMGEQVKANVNDRQEIIVLVNEDEFF